MPREPLTHDDLRQSGRFRMVSFAWYQVLGETEGGLARSCDISRGGVGLVTARAVEPGSRVFVKLVHKGRGVSLLGSVMHCRSEGSLYRLGLGIEIVPPVDRATIAWILDS